MKIKHVSDYFNYDLSSNVFIERPIMKKERSVTVFPKGCPGMNLSLSCQQLVGELGPVILGRLMQHRQMVEAKVLLVPALLRVAAAS